CLIEECVRRFNWEAHENDLTPNRTVLAILARRRDIETLADLKSREDEIGRAFDRMTRPPNPLLRWLRANLWELRRWPEMALLRMLKDKHPKLLRELDAAQIAWWERFIARPQLSYGLVRFGFAMVWLCLFAFPYTLPDSAIGYRIVLVLAGYVAVFA